MSVQELLTYVEELSFKTSMIGYDKDEVDIQLDKICDEIEAIVKEKDDEIAALRSGSPAAPVVVELNQKKEAESPAEGKTEVSGNSKAFSELSADEDVKSLKMEINDLSGQLVQMQSENDALKKRLTQMEEELAEADMRAGEAEKYAQSAQAKIDALEEQLVDREPQNKDEAYALYMKNADLLCKQLAAVDAQKEAAFQEARAEAEGIIAEAKAEQERIIGETETEKERILGEARTGAEEIAAEAEEKRAKAEEDLARIIEEGRTRKQQDEEDYLDLLEKKDSLIEFMKEINSDISDLIEKADAESEW